MYQLIRKTWPILVLIILGMAGGYLYWRFIGCEHGSCPITSNRYSSLLAGGILGYLSGGIVTDFLRKPGK